MNDLKLVDIAKKYNQIEEIWPKNDSWHQKTYLEIKQFITNNLSKEKGENIAILNAGSGGNSYGMKDDKMVHVDIASKKIKDNSLALIASIENLPIKNGVFQFIICVGSALNYCDPMLVLPEFSRLLMENSKLILEFEISNSWEYLGTRHFNKKATLSTTFYNGVKENIWIFSENYIIDLLRRNNFEIFKIKRFHQLSPLIYRLCNNPYYASSAICFDSILNKIPFLRKLSSNVILLSQKKISFK